MEGFEQDEEIVADFLKESGELLSGLDASFIELEQKPDDQDILNAIFRAVHTVKGAAGFMGFKQIVELAHTGESVLNKLRQGGLKVNPDIMDALLKTVDTLKLLLLHIKEKDGISEETADLVRCLEIIRDGTSPAPEPPPTAVAEQTILSATSSMPESVSLQAAVPAIETGIAEPAKMDVQPELTANEPLKSTQQSNPPKTSSPKEAAETIRVDVRRLEDVMNMVGELVLSRNRLLRLGSQLEDRYAEDDVVSMVKQAVANLDVITSDLQLSVMKARMQPISKVFGKFSRIVRDLARARGKDIELFLSGEGTELDRTIIEDIGDPLVHMVRNAIDHGIENPDERILAGKPGRGRLELSACQKGSNILITIEDDGKGINTDRIKEKAVEGGLATRAEMDKLPEREVLDFIFKPGFSTAKEVTDISGRGVGMDVVRTNIIKLNGSIDIDNYPGKGARITIKLPLTLAIISVLVVRTGSEQYAIPLSSVNEIVKMEESEIRFVDNKEVLYLRNRIYPIKRLSSLLLAGDSSGEGYAVITAFGEKRAAVLVDGLAGQEEVVIKPVGEYLSNTKGISGVTINGDGKVVLILDMNGLFSGLKEAGA